MSNRAEDASRPHGAWGRQPPWPSSPEHAGARDDRSRGYPQDDDYPASGGFGYGPDGYPGAQPGYEPAGYEPAGYEPAGYEPAGYEQPGYDQPTYDQPGYGSHGQPGADGYGSPAGYGHQDDYGQQPGYGYPPGGYEQAGYEQPGYEQPGYEQAGYEQGSYDQRQATGYGGYDRSGGYPGQPGGSGGNPVLRGGTGDYPAQDAGNDWYGGQPAAANGASFADTGTYRLNGRIIDEYGTGPRGALRDPVRGYAPGPDPAGTGASPSLSPSGPNAFETGGSQERYDDYAPYPGYPQGQPGPGPDDYDDYAGYDQDNGRPEPAPRRGYQDTGYGDRDGFDGRGPAGGDQSAADPYQERYGTGPRAARSSRRTPVRNDPAKNGRKLALSKRTLLYAVLAVIVIGVACAAAYVFVLKPKPAANTPNPQGALPTSGPSASQGACAQTLGTYCHIADRGGDPAPLTMAELFPPAFANETDKISFSLVASRLDKKCSDAVYGQDLIAELKKGDCTQVLRATYVGADSKIMGTIGVINLKTANEAHYAGRVVGDSDFIKPLNATKGPASKMDKGTGLVESHFKGHYLILTYSLFTNLSSPSGKAQQKELEEFAQDLIAGTANVSLSQRMVTGAPASSAPSASASATPSASVSPSAS